jgi:hypothetical protein
MGYYDNASVSDLIGKTLISIRETGDNELIFVTDNGEKYRMYHSQSCCESVSIDDIVGDLSNLLNSPILMASEETNSNENVEGAEKPYDAESFTWTFYKFATIKGYVTIRWWGASNGYYSESVDFKKIS